MSRTSDNRRSVRRNRASRLRQDYPPTSSQRPALQRLNIPCNIRHSEPVPNLVAELVQINVDVLVLPLNDEPFREGLRQLGYIEGQNIVVE